MPEIQREGNMQDMAATVGVSALPCQPRASTELAACTCTSIGFLVFGTSLPHVRDRKNHLSLCGFKKQVKLNRAIRTKDSSNEMTHSFRNQSTNVTASFGLHIHSPHVIGP